MAIEPETSRFIPCGEETVMDLIIRFTCDEAGASAVEYGLLMALIAVVIVISVTTFGLAVRDSFVDSTAQMFGS